MTPAISVIMPAKDRPDAVENALRSLRGQSLAKEAYEVLLVDDGSSPPLAELLPNDLINDVHLIRLEPNQGPAAARNAALRQAKGRITVLVNSDGILHEDSLRLHLQHHPEDAPPKSVMGRFDWLEEQQTGFVRLLQQTGALFPYDSLPHLEPLSPRSFWTGNLSLPTAELRRVGGFDETFRHAIWEDVELGHRLDQAGIPLIFDSAIKCGHDHPFNLEAHIRRCWKMGYYWAQFSEKHGADTLPLMGQPTLATHSVGDEMVRGLLHSRLKCDLHIATLSQLEDAQEPAEGATLDERFVVALEMVTTFETMRGVVSYAFGLPAGAIQAHLQLDAGTCLVQFSAEYEPDLMADWAEQKPADTTLLWATPAIALPDDAAVPGVTLVAIPASVNSSDIWRPVLSGTDADVIVLLNGTSPPSSAVLNTLKRMLMISPVFGAVGYEQGQSTPRIGLLETPPDQALTMTTRHVLSADKPGHGSFVKRLEAQGLKTVQLR